MSNKALGGWVAGWGDGVVLDFGFWIFEKLGGWVVGRLGGWEEMDGFCLWESRGRKGRWERRWWCLGRRRRRNRKGR